MTDKATEVTVPKASMVTIEHVSGSGGLFLLIFIIWWLAGIVLAKGFWSCAIAITLPPYAMYLVVERVMIMLGVV